MRSQFDDDGSRPDVTEVVTQVSDVFRNNFRKFAWIIGILLIVILLIVSFYKVDPGEQAVVRTLGKVTATRGPGPGFIIPFVQQVDVVNVEQVRRIEVGFRADQRVPHEALMLTGDENIVEAQMIVQYKVTEPVKYLFRLNDPEDVLRSTAEVALRSMVGRTNIDEVITTGRASVQSETKEWLQTLMTAYQSGLSVTEVKLQTVDAPDEVKDAFHDVVRAREEKEKLINQARGYQEDIIPKARGNAQKLAREAEAYRERRVLEAKGDAAKFESMLREYTKAEQVTRQRLYLETMERLLDKIDKKVIIDEDVANGALPILPLGAVGALSAGGKE